MQKERIYTFDNLKFLLIVFVIIGHFVDHGGKPYSTDNGLGAFIFIYSFHMPLFIFISGLFYKAGNLQKKVLFYLSTAVVMNIVIFVCQRLLFQAGNLNFVHISNAVWFMVALAAFTMITHFIRRLNKPFVLLIWVIFACFVGYSKEVSTFLCISRIIVFYPFFLAGTMLDARKVSAVLSKPVFRIAGAALIAAGEKKNAVKAAALRVKKALEDEA